MKRLLMSFLITLTLVLTVAAQDAAPISGSWTFQIELPSGSSSAQANLTNDEAVVSGTITSQDGPLAVTGSADAESVRIYASKENSPVLIFNGTRGVGTMSGTIQVGAETVGKWSAKRN